MTEKANTTEERTHIRRDHSGTAESIARDLSREERALEMPCCVRHPDAGGQCWRKAEALVYGLLFCEVHGAEAKAGALSELYQDAGDFLERLDNPHVPIPNEEAAAVLHAAVGAVEKRHRDADRAEWDALRRAYPEIPERVDPEIIDHDYREPVSTPQDDYLDSRKLLHHMMRLAFLEGRVWLVEQLEAEREYVSAQSAFSMADYDRRVGPPRG